MKTLLKIAETEVSLGIDELQSIVSYLADNEKNSAIFQQLATHKSATIRKEIAYKDNLTEESVQLLLRDKDVAVLSNIVRSAAVKEIFSDEDFDYVVSRDNEELISDMLGSLDEYENLSDYSAALEKIIALENEKLTLIIAESYNTPKKILKKLLKHNDPDIVNAAKSSLE